MSTHVTTLSNGIRVASHAMDHLETVSLGVWVASGARHERPEQHGLSHLLEHMAFKGTATRNAQQIAEEIEDIGGDLNAATGLDMTAYYARVLKGDDGIALNILADILLNSSFSVSELDKEREVIQQEIAAAQDSPDDLVFDLVQQAAFPDQAIGRPILGTEKSVGALQASDLKSFLKERYTPGTMVISAAGAIDHEKLVRHAEALFGGLTQSQSEVERPAEYAGGVGASAKPFEQSHVVIGLPGPSYLEHDFYAAQVFSGLFGGGMSSRLFQEIRENRGLCYAIYSSVWGLRDAGMLAVHAATAPGKIEQLAAIVAAELADVADKGPSAAELHRSAAQLKAGLLMALESSSVRAEQMARHLLTHGALIPSQELVGRVDAVTRNGVRDVAARLALSAPSVAVVGSGKKSLEQAERTAAVLSKTLANPAPRTLAPAGT
ncbi:MAG: insulinase family protein [Hyphomicrobium sp.]|nr:insulinase family protein [Hyphomicrobium sp.]